MTTATRERITREEALSEQELVRHNLARFVNKITNHGETIAQFLHDTVQGEYPDAKHHHRQQAARDLAVISGQMPEDTPGSAARVVREERAPKPKKPKVTLKQIINKPIGEYIRGETHDCRKLIIALDDIMHPPYVFESANPDERKYQKITQIRSNHRVAAAKEMIKRGIGSRIPYSHPRTSSMEERMLNSRLSQEIREVAGNGIGLARFLLDIVDNPKTYGKGIIITDPYTQTHRIWALKHMIWRGADIPWEHLTPEMIDEYLRDLNEKDRLETERRAAERHAAAHAPLTPEQDANVRAMFDEMQRAMDESDAKAAAKAEKKAQKSANKADASKAATLDAANKDTGDTAGNTDAPTPTTPTDRGATAVANALQNHPEVDLDTALANFPETVGVPKGEPNPRPNLPRHHSRGELPKTPAKIQKPPAHRRPRRRIRPQIPQPLARQIRGASRPQKFFAYFFIKK